MLGFMAMISLGFQDPMRSALDPLFTDKDSENERGSAIFPMSYNQGAMCQLAT